MLNDCAKVGGLYGVPLVLDKGLFSCYSEGMKMTKVSRGWYATEDGRYAAIADGYEKSLSCGAEGDYDGFPGGEWAAIYSPGGGLREESQIGDNLDWFPTKREAVECAERYELSFGKELDKLRISC